MLKNQVNCKKSNLCKLRIVITFITLGLVIFMFGCGSPPESDSPDGINSGIIAEQDNSPTLDEPIEEIGLYADHILIGRWHYLFGQNAGFFSDGEIERIQFHDDGQFRVAEEVDGFLRNWATRTWEPIDDEQLLITERNGETTIYSYAIIESGDTPPVISILISKSEYVYELYRFVD
jgi:hypothetical protein